MAYKTFQVDSIGQITVYKRRNSRHIRLSVGNGGVIKVSLPYWLPYRAGTSYAVGKKAWLETQLAKRPASVLSNKKQVGKLRKLVFVATGCNRPNSKLTANEVVINYPFELSETDLEVQKIAKQACRRALKDEAQRRIPPRIEELSKIHGLKFKEVQIRHLKSRWGSCDQNKRIKISYFIVSLPNELIDYVLLHELAHTKHLNHGKSFWSLMLDLDSANKAHRKQLSNFSPADF